MKIKVVELNSYIDDLISLNNYIDDLIDLAHKKYMSCCSETERVGFDGQIKAYWKVKECVENILVIGCKQ